MENKIALVTGGNKGIGFEICLQLAEAEFKVILTARDHKKGSEAAEKLKHVGLDVIFHPLDVTDESSIKKLKEHITKEFGRLDVLINNAGIISTNKGMSLTPMDEFRKVMDTNYFGVIETTQALVPLLKKSKEGRIINISSGMGAHESLLGDYAAYRLSKAGLNNITMMFATELLEFGIKVNAVCPGWVKTDMGGANAPRTPKDGADTPVSLAMSESIPTGKFFRDRQEIEW